MSTTDKMQVLAMHLAAHNYIERHTERQEILSALRVWGQQALQKHDPTDELSMGVILMTATNVSIANTSNPQFGHIFSLVFEDEKIPKEKWKHEDIFLRVSETGQIVELCQLHPTLH